MHVESIVLVPPMHVESAQFLDGNLKPLEMDKRGFIDVMFLTRAVITLDYLMWVFDTTRHLYSFRMDKHRFKYVSFLTEGA